LTVKKLQVALPPGECNGYSQLALPPRCPLHQLTLAVTLARWKNVLVKVN